jgi:50S ribosomal protein L16 3-hydroxylase
LPADPAAIDDETVERLQRIILERVQDKAALATWFGRHMTEPRYPELIQPLDISSDILTDDLESGYGLVRNPSARLAYRLEADEQLVLFASGEHCVLPPSLLPLVQLVCNNDYLDSDTILAWRSNAEGWTLIEQLLAKGDLLLEGDDE